MNYAKCKEGFAVPGDDSLIDLRMPDTGLSSVYGESLDAIRLRYPGAEIVDVDVWMRAKAERQHVPVVWMPTTEARYHEMLEVLPPAVHLQSGFLVGEPWDHDAETGAPRFAAFRQRGGTFEEANRPMTAAEFRRALGG